MKLLFDECVPRKLKNSFSRQHECRTVQECGWARLENGDLLQVANNRFDVLLTVDRGFQYQQDMAGRTIAVLVIHVASNRLEDCLPHVAACVVAACVDVLRSIQPGEVVHVGQSS